MSEEAETKLARARAIIRTRAPYIMRTIYGFIPMMVPELRTMGVSKGMVLILDPVWLCSIEDKHVAAALFHEAMHVVRDHLPRMENFPNKDLANIAGDLAINPELRAAGWELPHGVFPEDYGFSTGLTMEEYYKLLEKRAQQQAQQQQKSSGGGGQGQKKQQGQDQQPQQGGGQGSGGQQGGGPKDPQQGQGKQQPQQGQGPSGQQPSQGQQQGGGAGQQQGQNQTQSGAGGQGQSKGQGQNPGQGQGGGGGSHLPDGRTPGVGSGCCGGAGGKPVSGIEQKINEEHGRSEIDQKRIVKQTLEDIKQHAAEHGRGSVPSSLLQSIDIVEQKSKVRWQDKLQHILKKCSGRIEAGGMDYSLARPSKRSYARGFPRPGMVQYQPEVAFILDTSGSMGDKQIIEALVEAIGIFKTLGLDNVWFLQADAAVAKSAKRIRLKDLMGRVKIHGRGGTNFDPALRAAEKLKPKPDLIVYLTDGDGHVSFRPKGVEVIWCIVRNHWNQKPPCDWGHTVIIAEEAKGNFRMPRTGTAR